MEVGEAVRGDRLAQPCHESRVEREVVGAEQGGGNSLLGSKQVVQPGAAVVTAGQALALLIERSDIVPVRSPRNVQPAGRSEDDAPTSKPRRNHAVEEIHTEPGGFDQVRWESSPHEVPRSLFSEHFGGKRRHPAGVFARFSHQQPADSESVEAFPRGAEGHEGPGVVPPHVRQGPALDDPEKELARGPLRHERALRPPEAAGRRSFNLFRRGGQGEAFVKHHRDVGSEVPLDLDRPLRSQVVGRPVPIGAQMHSGLRNLAEVLQACHLVAAAVGEDRPIPGHQAVQAAERGDPFVSRLQHQMPSVA